MRLKVSLPLTPTPYSPRCPILPGRPTATKFLNNYPEILN